MEALLPAIPVRNITARILSKNWKRGRGGERCSDLKTRERSMHRKGLREKRARYYNRWLSSARVRARESGTYSSPSFFLHSACRLADFRDNYHEGTRREMRTSGKEAGVQNEFVYAQYKGTRRRRRRRRDIDRAGAVIGKTCLSILQSIIERHCHVNGNRIEIAMEMAVCRRDSYES